MLQIRFEKALFSKTMKLGVNEKQPQMRSGFNNVMTDKANSIFRQSSQYLIKRQTYKTETGYH